MDEKLVLQDDGYVVSEKWLYEDTRLQEIRKFVDSQTALVNQIANQKSKAGLTAAKRDLLLLESEYERALTLRDTHYHKQSANYLIAMAIETVKEEFERTDAKARKMLVKAAEATNLWWSLKSNLDDISVACAMAENIQGLLEMLTDENNSLPMTVGRIITTYNHWKRSLQERVTNNQSMNLRFSEQATNCAAAELLRSFRRDFASDIERLESLYRHDKLHRDDWVDGDLVGYSYGGEVVKKVEMNLEIEKTIIQNGSVTPLFWGGEHVSTIEFESKASA